jgi:hypothetical protein
MIVNLAPPYIVYLIVFIAILINAILVNPEVSYFEFLGDCNRVLNDLRAGLGQ